MEINDRAKAFSANIAAIEGVTLDDKAKGKLVELKASLQKFRAVRTKVLALAMENKNVEAYTLYLASGESLSKELNDKCHAANDKWQPTNCIIRKRNQRPQQECLGGSPDGIGRHRGAIGIYGRNRLIEPEPC